MEIQHRRVDKARGIIQITATDERWYTREVEGQLQIRPSVTWITGHYPKGKGFEIWLRRTGNAADEIRDAAGDEGSTIHAACGDLLAGKIVKHDAVYFNETSGRPEQITPYEMDGVLSFIDWYENDRRCGLGKGCTVGQHCLQIIAHDLVLWPDDYDAAGTLDIKAVRSCDGSFGIIDLKRSKAIYAGHRAQVQAYRKFDVDTRRSNGWAAILQLSYPYNKKQKYKLTIVPNKDWSLFLTARRIWREQSANVKPHQKDYPLAMMLTDRQQPDIAT